jgi:prephenate dehydrogenase
MTIENTSISSSEPDFLGEARVCILGLGLMGGSLAMALRDRCALLLGVDPDEKVLAQALERGIVERASSDPGVLLPESDLVILAAPVRSILRLLELLPELHPGHTVVLDLGSTKTQIVKAMANLPKRFDPVGGHPMCGKEKTSLANAEPGLFIEAPFALTALPRSSPQACILAEQVVRAVGARPLWMDPHIHDRWTARTSHFSYILANLLATITPPEAWPLVGPGFRSTTRVASTSPEIMLDILLTNRVELLSAIADFRMELDLLERYLVDAEEIGLHKILSSGASRRQELLGLADIGAGQ